MKVTKMQNICVVFMFCIALCGCGTYYPYMQEAWEDPTASDQFHLEIKSKVFCEIVNAIKDVNGDVARTIGGVKLDSIPAYYGVQAEINLQVSESSGVAPSITYSPFIGATQPLNLGLGGELSSTATRTDTLYAYWDVGRIAAKGKNEQECSKNRLFKRNSSLLTESDLGIKDFLYSASLQANQYPSSKPPESKKDLKTDVYSYQIKFEIISNGGINPSFKLVRLSGNNGGKSFLSTGRSRTHYLLLTFGPNEIVDPNKIPIGRILTSSGPSQAALNSHFAAQIGIAIQSGLSSARQ